MNKKIVHSVFEHIATLFPDSIAIEEESHSTSYSKLNFLANELAYLLGANLSSAPARVGLFFDSSSPYVASVLGVMKAGGIFVPFDITIPESRLRKMVEKCSPELILSGTDQFESVCAFLDQLDQHGVRCVIEVTQEGIGRTNLYQSTELEAPIRTTTNYPSLVTPDDASYIYFTSGSTGQPKPILGCHKSISHFVHWESAEFGLDENMRVSQLTPITFDANLRDLFLPLIKGGRVCIPSKSTKEQPSKLLKWLDAQEVNIIHCVPSLFKVLTRELSESSDVELQSLKYIMMAGEPLYGLDVQKWRLVHGTQVELVNFYGASETTMIKTFYRLPSETPPAKQLIPIGHPISNSAVLIIQGNKLCLPGKIGEIYIKTPFATKGYFEEPELTAESFVQNPLSDVPDLIYKTGDLGKYQEDHTIEFIGRLDSQVKVNGIRIELSEIEQCLLSHPSINEAVVRSHTNGENELSLLSYYTAQETLTSTTVRDWLKTLLPEYMLPGFYVQLESFPLNINGKIDKKSLPQPEELLFSGKEFIEASTETEKHLSAIWSEILGLKRIGTNFKFFEIGGHSLKATRIISRILQELNVHVTIREFFDNPTIQGLSEIIDDKHQVEYTPIPNVGKQSSYDLSDAQRSIWLATQLGGQGTTFNMFGAVEFSGKLNHEALKKAFIHLIERHEILRTNFKMIHGKAQQVVSAEATFDWVNPPVSEIANAREGLELILNEEVNHVFDIGKDQLVRARLIPLSEEKTALILTIHHIINDGWSFNILFDELLLCYEAFTKDEIPKLPKLSIQYKDYSSWISNHFKETEESSKEFWKEKLSRLPEPLHLPFDRDRNVARPAKGAMIRRTYSEQFVQLLNNAVRDSGVSLFTYLQSLLNVQLYSYSQQSHIALGTSVSGRIHPELETQLGCFVNTIVLENELKETDSFSELVEEINETTKAAFEHQAYPFDALFELIQPKVEPGRSPFFDVMIVLQNQTSIDLKMTDLTISEIPTPHVDNKFDLTYFFKETASGLQLDLEYNAAYFDASTIERFCDHFEELGHILLTNPSLTLEEIQFSGSTVEALLDEWEESVPDFQPVFKSFERIVTLFPDSIAIEEESHSTSYSKLNVMANELAYLLGANLSSASARVGLFFDSSSSYVASVLGVMKAGGIFVPFDITIPESRLRKMLEKCSPEFILSGTDQFESVCTFLDQLDQHGVRCVVEVAKDGMGRTKLYQGTELETPIRTTTNYPSLVTPDDASYIYFTSGSTGQPKPILGCHKSISHFVHWESAEFGLDENMRVSQLTPITFDANLRDLFLPLIKGGRVCIPSKSTKEQPSKLLKWLDAQEVNIIHCVPSLFKVLTRELSESSDVELQSLQYIMMAGEPLYGLDVEKWRLVHGTQVELVNFYGASETTMIKTFYRLPSETPPAKQLIPIGHPISNSAVLIIQGNKLCLPGKIGEIYIKTPFATKGYFEEPELTAESFVQNPLSDVPDLIYKTGDLGKYQEDHTIEFIGRLDSQVKVNGIRIELSEIEQCLLSHPSINEAVVRSHTNGENELSLLSYYTAQETLTSTTVRDWLKTLLPEYMLPGFYVQLESFPLNINGKIDKKSLPQPEELLFSGKEFIEASTETEKHLSAIWSEILGLKRIGTNFKFFEIGGHSLKATRIISRIYQDLRVEMTLKEFFENTTISQLATLIDARSKVNYEAIPIVAQQDTYDLSDAQRRIWVLEQMNSGTTSYNMFSSLVIKGEIDYDAFNEAFEYLSQRHEILRTAFIMVDGRPQQKVLNEIFNPLSIKDLSNVPNQDERVNDYLIADAEHLFDLEKGRLIISRLYQLSEEEHVLNLNMHHIISDGWSMNILLDDIAFIYNARKEGKLNGKKALNVQYKDFTQWRNGKLEDERMQSHRNYWTDRFSTPVTPIELSPTGKRPRLKTYAGSEYRWSISKEKSDQLKELGVAADTTVFTVLATLINVLISRYSGAKDIIIGTPVSGRSHPDIDYNLGCFINTLPIRTEIEFDNSFKALLSVVRDNLAEAFHHQEYPFDRLVDDLDLPRDVSRSPLFDVLMVIHHESYDEHQLRGLEIATHPFKDPMCKFDLSFNMFDKKEGIVIDFEYNSDIFSETYICQIQQSFELLVNAVVEDADQIIGVLPIVDSIKQDEINKEELMEMTLPSTIIEAFEACVSEHPDQIAVFFDDQHYSYKQLDEYSNKIANSLRDKIDAETGTRVALILERSEWMIAAILGTLKAGYAYVPIEPGIPKERIDFMLNESNCACVLTNREFSSQLESLQIPCIEIEGLAAMSKEFISKNLETNDLAYVIYTSGSTGYPKGVMIEHKSVLNLINGLNQRVLSHYNEPLNIALLASYSFDASIQQIFSALLLGHTLHVVPQSVKQDAEVLTNYLLEQKIHIMDGTPTLLGILLESKFLTVEKLELKHLLIGGEPLSGHLIQQFYSHSVNKNVRISNVYGPTETCVDVTEFTLSAQSKIENGVVSIGTPLPGVSLMIIDDYGQLVPKGVIGEIFISGQNVARGYINQPELSKKVFAPISKNHSITGYRSGDFARWNEDGTIRYEGRRDQQVKIKGYRIELGEVESKLKQIKDVKEVAVVVRPKDETSIMVAYLVSSREVDILEVRMELGKTLPEYMIPQFVMSLDQIPLNKNGKLDRSALPDPTMTTISGENFIAPKQGKEQILAKVWEKILGRESISTNDNFFALGGDSIKAIQMVAALKQHSFLTTVQDIFQYPTITELSWNINEIERPEEEESVVGEVELTPIQHWFFDTILTDSHHFNQAVLLKTERDINSDKIREVFKHLCNHHDMLRAAFSQEGERIIQNIGEPLDTIELIEIDLTSHFNYKEVLTIRATEIQQSIILSNAPLIKLAKFKTDDGDRLMIVAHHLVIDGVSWRILADDLSRIYSSLQKGEVPKMIPRTSSYQKWAKSLLEFAQSGSVKAELPYWMQVESAIIQNDEEYSPGITENYHCTLNKTATSLLLTEANKAYTTDVNILLLTAFCEAYFKENISQTMSVMLEGHGREELEVPLDTTRTIGWFTSMYPLVLSRCAEENAGVKIKSVKENIRSIPNKGVGYGALRYLTEEGKVLVKQPEILFNYLGEFSEESAGMFTLASEGVGATSSKKSSNGFSLNVNAEVKDRQLEISVSYDSNRWEMKQIKALFDSTLLELEMLISYCCEQKETEVTYSDVSSSEITPSEFNSLFD